MNLSPYPAYQHVYRLKRDALMNLSYYFTFEHRDDVDVLSYVKPFLKEVMQWRRCHGESALIQMDKGNRLLIWDWRPIAKQALTVLTGHRKFAYQACDQMRTARQVMELWQKESGASITLANFDEALEELTASGLMIKRDELFLALALPAAADTVVLYSRADSAAAQRAQAEAAHEALGAGPPQLGVAAQHRWQVLDHQIGDGLGGDLQLVGHQRPHAQRAGVAHAIEFHGGDALERAAPPLPGTLPGTLMLNPPYGERIAVAGKAARPVRAPAENRELPQDFFTRLAAHWKRAYTQHPAGWTAWVLTPDLKLPSKMRLKESRRVPMWNGPIECRLFRFDMVAGSNKADADAGR